MVASATALCLKRLRDVQHREVSEKSAVRHEGRSWALHFEMPMRIIER
jgi:hypothetical protein